MQLILILLLFGIATGVIARRKGSSFFIWFLIGFCVPFIGLAAAILYRVEREEPERECPRCRARLKRYVQVCPRCNYDI